MSEISAETFAQRAFDANLLSAQQVEIVWGELGTRNVKAEDFHRLLVRKELLTNYQVDRLLSGERQGYFWGDYKVLYLAGSGTFARVYRASHRESGQMAAVKVLRKRYSDDPSKKEEFHREGKLVMELRHPNIVPIYDVGEEYGRDYMVMEFVEGHNLREFLRIRKKFSPLEAMRLLTDVASALDYALQKGITHRDLKLTNVLVSSQGQARLVDFGLAALAALAAEGTRSARSIDYAGLERASGVRRDDSRSDIYFAGCILYHILSGQAPLSDTKERVKRLDVSRYRDIKPIGDLEPALPRSVLALVAKAMDIRPDHRFATPAELLAELKRTIARLEEGETAPAEAEADGARQAAPAPPPSVEQEGASRTVMIVESSGEMQDLLRERLKQRGYRVLVISDPERALARFGPGQRAADCVLFSVSGLGEPALDAFNRFGADEHTRDIPAILLVDQDQQTMLRQARLAEHRVPMSMPIKLKELRALLRKLIAAAGGQSASPPGDD